MPLESTLRIKPLTAPKYMVSYKFCAPFTSLRLVASLMSFWIASPPYSQLGVVAQALS